MSAAVSFVKLPVEPADPWFGLRWQDRALGADMFRVFGNDECLDVPLEEVTDVVCRRLAVDGRDRPTVRRAIERLMTAGLIVPDGKVTRLLYSRDAYRCWLHRPRSGERPVNGQSSSGEPPVNGQSSSGERPVNGQSSSGESEPSAHNCSTHVSQIERKKEKKEEIERENARVARDPLPHSEVELEEGEPEPEASTLDLVERAYKTRLVMATGNPPGSSQKLREHYRALAAWVDEKNGDAKRLITSLMDGFFRDKWAQKKSYPLGALAGDPGKYLNAQRNGRGYLHTSTSFGPASSLDDIGPPAPGEAE